MKIGNILLLTAGCILLLFGSLYFLTRPAIFESWDFSGKGQIGDTIGGITSPIINIIGSILIFISFISQNTANNLQSQESSFVFLHSLYNDIKVDYENITFISSSVQNGKEFKGRRAISIFIEILPKRLKNLTFKNNSFFYEYLFVVGSISILLDQIDQANILKKDKLVLLQMLHFFFEARLKGQNDEILDILNGDTEHSKFYEVLQGFSLKMEKSHLTNFT